MSQQQRDAPPLSRRVKRQLKAAARGFTADSPQMLAAIARQQQPEWQFGERKRLKKEKEELRKLLHQSYDEHASTKQVCLHRTKFIPSMQCVAHILVALCSNRTAPSELPILIWRSA